MIIHLGRPKRLDPNNNGWCFKDDIPFNDHEFGLPMSVFFGGKTWVIYGLGTPHRTQQRSQQLYSVGHVQLPGGTLDSRKGCLRFQSLAIHCEFFGIVKWPFKWLSDLQLRHQKVTLNHLVYDVSDRLFQWSRYFEASSWWLTLDDWPLMWAIFGR